jgi:hypothetical protein
MISHFLKRDLKDSMVFWIVLGLMSVLILGAYWWSPSESLIMCLGWLYFIFSQFVTLNITGTLIRTDHMISRQYFLSLPLKRNSFFLITLLRLSVFYLPLWLYLIIMVSLFSISRKLYLLPSFYISFLVFLFAISLTLIWWISHGLLYSLLLERSLRFSNSTKRLLTALVPMFLFLAEASVFFFCFFWALKLLLGFGALPYPSLEFPVILICLGVPVSITAITLRLSKTRWTSVA